MKYGNAPEVVGKPGQFTLQPTEMCFVQYMPIAMPMTNYRIPPNLLWVWPLIMAVNIKPDNYVYLTVKYMYQTKGDRYNRLGFHTDGFGTDDINYLWSDCNPTEFYVQDFNILERGKGDFHEESMLQMQAQALATKQVIYPNNTLLKLDSSVVHRVSPRCEDGYRAFVKISVSKDKYNLKFNSHNYLFDYDWEMVERKLERNCPNENHNQ